MATDVAGAVAAPANGNIVRAHLSGGNVQTQSLAPLAGSAWTTWTTLAAAVAPPAGFGVALAALGDTVAIAYPTSTTAIAVRISTNDGATWGSAAAVANTGVITDLALAYAPNGDLLLVTGDTGGTIRAFRSNGGGAFAAAVTLVPGGSEFINSIALAYSGDWLALFNWQNANLNYLASAIFGNGGQQTANTWSAVTDTLGIAPGNAALPNVSGFAWGSDGGHAILVENWFTPSYTDNPTFAMECSSPTAFAGGYWTEPAPFAYDGLNGADIAYSQQTAGLYACAGENMVALLSPPADVDVSNRIISFVQHSAQHQGTLTIALDNSDQALSGLAQSRGTIGLRLDLSLGFQTTVGTFSAQQPQRWITKAEASWVAGRFLVTLTARDGWALLHQLEARRQAQFGTTLGIPTRTVDQIIHWLCARAAIDYTSPGASSLRSRTPNWNILPGRSYGTAMLDLLDAIEGWLLMTSYGATVIGLSSSDPSSYSYGAAGQHPVIQIFHQVELQPANLVTVYTGTAEVLPEVIAAQAADPTDAHLLGLTSHSYADVQLELGNAQATANALLRKAQLSVPAHGFTSQPQVSQQLGDVVTLTDVLSGQTFTGRVQTHTIHFDRERGLWLHQTTISQV